MMSRITTPSKIDLEAILNSTQDGIFIVDRDRRVVLFNDACEKLTGYSRDEVLGTQCQCHDVTECQDEYGRSPMGRLCPSLRVFGGHVPAARQRMRFRRRDGSSIWTETTYTPLPDGNGGVSCVLAVVHDITDLKEQEDRLRISTENLREQVDQLRGEIRQQYGFSTIISRSTQMQAVFAKIRAACDNDCSVLISGEPGTGKELVASTIHYNGLQRDGPFVPLSCSALAPHLLESELFGHVKGAFDGATMDFQGLLRAAEGGTVFLDEITEAPLDTQAKLLRVLEDRRVRPVGSTRDVGVNVRVIAATDADPAEAVETGSLRKDLFYRLGVVAIEVPPLRQRKEDIPFLVEHFISRFNRKSRRQVSDVAPEVWPTLLRYDWPGNVGELQNAVESAFAVSESKCLQASDLPHLVQGEVVEFREQADASDMPLDEILATVERRALLAALRRASGQRSRAARQIGISRSRLYRRMEALGIRPREVL
ncbi:MAG: sigma 54-interacting transcriptional regulator [Planctomycetes bacterium]|nr:sigma 54-interacting transcriptional regulator [Planctomycetota bacterium]